jgi:hypothetical protein
LLVFNHYRRGWRGRFLYRKSRRVDVHAFAGLMPMMACRAM